jgi:antagonist of KipI
MTLDVLEIGGLATIQDDGRVGWRKFGVPASGPMDMFAFRAAHALAGNPPDAALLEIGLGDVAFRAQQDCILAVTGMGYRLSIYIWDFPLWGSFFVRAGWTVRLSKTGDGMWSYLAVAGGIRAPPVLGSRSTYLRGAFGGWDGRQLQTGDTLQTGNLARLPHELSGRLLPEEARPDYQSQPVVDMIMGPQTEQFSDEEIATFLSSEYSVSGASDRMGYRLDGPALAQRARSELVSEGMLPGAIQIPPGGQPIVMMADCPTTGGYAKIGTVTGADLPLLAQCVPQTSSVRFRETTVEAAQQKFRDLVAGLPGRIVETE